MDPDPDLDLDHSIFVIKLQDPNKELILKEFLLITGTFAGKFPSLFKDKKSKRSHKTVETKVFLTIFA
jgi:hypothetical protein